MEKYKASFSPVEEEVFWGKIEKELGEKAYKDFGEVVENGEFSTCIGSKELEIYLNNLIDKYRRLAKIS